MITDFELTEECVYVKEARNGVPSTASAIEKAKIEGLEVVYPEVNELQIDIDNSADYAVWAAHRATIDQHFTITKVVETPSKERGHWHITVATKKNLNHFERIAFQACLGSDRKRELLGLLMVMFGHEREPTLFLEPKNNGRKSISQK